MTIPSTHGTDPSIPRTGRIGRLAHIIEKELDSDTLYRIMKDAHAFPTYTYPEKAAYMKTVIERLENSAGIDVAENIMKGCGYKCCGKTSQNRARTLMKESTSLEECIEKLNKTGLGGGRLTMQDSHTITGGYDRCYCGQVKHTRVLFPSLTYCHCSTGWYAQLFETILGRPVAVDILQSIICGADSCEFVIHL
ncbi:MAG: hypothetical protein HXS47_10070 [Theionarchaea archaeon]|nr:hypothetical protein [Theionarchaea archaeon]